jgi:UDP-N-acetylmuramoyl-tripeptide--D-alanyl-D-alanine ligase
MLRKFRTGACLLLRRRFHNTRFIAITGSCGKTSATHFLGKILSDYFPTHVGVKNNCISAIMITLRDARRRHRFVVQETGISAPGMMSPSVRLLRPDIGIVTTVGQDHHTSFRTLEATAAEKGILIESLPESGTAVLNADDSHVLAMGKRTRAAILTYGLSESADVRAASIRAVWPDRLSLTVIFRGEQVRIETNLFGDLVVPSILSAVAGALVCGVSLSQCAESLKGIEAVPRRMSVHRNRSGVWFVDDSYKAPFWSVEKAIMQVKDVLAPRKTLVMGSFSDTPGSDSSKYRAMARLGLQIADRVIFVGGKAVYIKKMMMPGTEGRLYAFDTTEPVYDLLVQTALPDELVLIKSNDSERLDILISRCQADGEDAESCRD